MKTNVVKADRPFLAAVRQKDCVPHDVDDNVISKMRFPSAPSGVRVLRMKDLVDRTGLSRATLYVLMGTDTAFPRKIQLSARTIGFYEHEVEAWIEARAAARQTAKAVA